PVLGEWARVTACSVYGRPFSRVNSNLTPIHPSPISPNVRIPPPGHHLRQVTPRIRTATVDIRKPIRLRKLTTRQRRAVPSRPVPIDGKRNHGPPHVRRALGDREVWDAGDRLPPGALRNAERVEHRLR